jgi:putative ubiquitin-RnfH superfamily antitoxin RatB of RatAB toxin-antitoxin module
MDKRAEPIVGQEEWARSPESSIDVELVWVAQPSEGADRSGRTPQIEERQLSLAQGTTIAAALEATVPDAVRTALLEGRLTLAVFGERRTPGAPLHDGDRIELLGPLLADPKQSRLRRARVQRARNGDSRWQKR